jgi:hypothetical protein
MNLYDQYLALLQIFFHHQDKRTARHEELSSDMTVKEEELLRDAA